MIQGGSDHVFVDVFPEVGTSFLYSAVVLIIELEALPFCLTFEQLVVRKGESCILIAQRSEQAHLVEFEVLATAIQGEFRACFDRVREPPLKHVYTDESPGELA